MKAILIDPGERSVATIDITKMSKGTELTNQTVASLHDLYELVGEECIDACYFIPGESIIVADHSALQNPPLPSYFVRGDRKMHLLFGKGVVIGYSTGGEERETRLSVDDMYKLITWNQ
jgi:hypothetical protein